MASAAAVATDISKSPIPEREVNQELNSVGGITRADTFRSPDSESDDDGVTPRVRRNVSKNGVNPQITGDEDDDAALFGSGSDDDLTAQQGTVDDDELDSGEETRHVGRRDEEEAATAGDAGGLEEEESLELDLGRGPIPEPSDGEVSMSKGRCVYLTDHKLCSCTS